MPCELNFIAKDEGPVKTERWDAGTVMCLGHGADLHVAQVMPMPLTMSCSSKRTLVLCVCMGAEGGGRYADTVLCLRFLH